MGIIIFINCIAEISQVHHSNYISCLKEIWGRTLLVCNAFSHSLFAALLTSVTTGNWQKCFSVAGVSYWTTDVTLEPTGRECMASYHLSFVQSARATFDNISCYQVYQTLFQFSLGSFLDPFLCPLYSHQRLKFLGFLLISGETSRFNAVQILLKCSLKSDQVKCVARYKLCCYDDNWTFTW